MLRLSQRKESRHLSLHRLVADVCVKPTITLLPRSFTLRQDSWLDYWLSQCLLHCSLTQPHPPPLQHPVACRLLLKPVCSSPGCQSFPVLVVPLFTPLLLPLTSLFSLALSAVAFTWLPPSWWSTENWKQRLVRGGESTEECKVYLCLPSESLFSLFRRGHCSLYFDETAPSVVAAAQCKSRHFPLMSAFEMPILCVILVKWSTLLSVGIHSVPWNKSVKWKSSFWYLSHTHDICLIVLFFWSECFYRLPAVAIAGSFV